MLYNPFEQFITIPLIDITLKKLDFTFSNTTLCLFLIFLSLLYTINIILDKKTSSLYAILTPLENHIFLIYIAVQSIIEKHIHVKFYQQIIFPITLCLGIFLLALNLSGNLPLFMSLTSQFSIITAFCIPTFIGIFLWFFFDRQLTFLRTFYAPGTEIILAIVLFPVELLTYLMRPISIICRLCSNIMSGHVIVKVCLHTIFALSQIKNSSSFLLSITISILILQLVPLLLLEFCVSLIQVYVFLVIFCMFLSDTFGHHYKH
jgi:F-type H+-transporting ATPase subunit a